MGAVLFELLTGQMWCNAKLKVDSVSELRPDVSPELNKIIMRMLADTPGRRKADETDPNKRYISMGAVQAAIVGLNQKPSLWQKLKKFRVIGGAILITSFCVLILFIGSNANWFRPLISPTPTPTLLVVENIKNPTPTPTATPSQTPTATNAPPATATDTATATATPMPSPTPAPPTATLTQTLPPSATATPFTPTLTPTVTLPPATATATATLVPTLAPAFAAPTLLGPEDGFKIEGDLTDHRLTWSAVDLSLDENAYYVLHITHSQGHDYTWQKEPQFDLKEKPWLMQDVTEHTWRIVIAATVSPELNQPPTGFERSAYTATRSFYWQSAAPTGTPLPTVPPT